MYQSILLSYLSVNILSIYQSILLSDLSANILPIYPSILVSYLSVNILPIYPSILLSYLSMNIITIYLTLYTYNHVVTRCIDPSEHCCNPEEDFSCKVLPCCQAVLDYNNRSKDRHPPKVSNYVSYFK